MLVPKNPLDEHGNFDPSSLGRLRGYAEGYAGRLEEHETVQFERLGYCILDKKEPSEFILTQK